MYMYNNYYNKVKHVQECSNNVNSFAKERIKYLYSKWFEPRSISSSCSVIVRVSVVLKRTVGDSD